MDTETETYTAHGHAYTITRQDCGSGLVNYYVTHDATGVRANGAFGTRGYATHYCLTDAQRRSR